jgi:hypothetical protein
MTSPADIIEADRTRRSWIIRISLFAVLAFLTAIVLLLLPWNKERYTADNAEELLRGLMAKGGTLRDAKAVLGSTSQEEDYIAGLHAGSVVTWRFANESIWQIKSTEISVYTQFESGDVISDVGRREKAVQGEELWRFRWTRLKKRLGLD